MTNTGNIKAQFEQLQQKELPGSLSIIRQKAFQAFNRMGIPTTRNEEWKYTRVNHLFDKASDLAFNEVNPVTDEDLAAFRLPGHEEANVLYFINGIYSAELSAVRSAGLTVLPLETAAANQFSPLIEKHFNHSGPYLKDGLQALNTALTEGGIFIYVPPKMATQHPVYIYHVNDNRQGPVLSQPRSLLVLDTQAQLQVVESYCSLAKTESLTNQVFEIVLENLATLEYYKIQNDHSLASQVSTTHIRQVGTSVVNAVTLTLDGGTVRNNLHAIMEAPHSEAHLYGLYYPGSNSHIDNHTIVDNATPHCLSNELYKGIMDGASTGVFNGKIFVRKDAQKTNAFQSNKNVLLSDTASINSKPQLEIYADDVKCSHGCTVGSLDQEGLFYLQSRGIPFKTAMGLLLQGFAMDILEKIKPGAIRTYAEGLIVARLNSHQS